jgi:hypothetical protein
LLPNTTATSNLVSLATSTSPKISTSLEFLVGDDCWGEFEKRLNNIVLVDDSISDVFELLIIMARMKDIDHVDYCS